MLEKMVFIKSLKYHQISSWIVWVWYDHIWQWSGNISKKTHFYCRMLLYPDPGSWSVWHYHFPTESPPLGCQGTGENSYWSPVFMEMMFWAIVRHCSGYQTTEPSDRRQYSLALTWLTFKLESCHHPTKREDTRQLYPALFLHSVCLGWPAVAVPTGFICSFIQKSWPAQ